MHKSVEHTIFPILTIPDANHNIPKFPIPFRWSTCFALGFIVTFQMLVLLSVGNLFAVSSEISTVSIGGDSPSDMAYDPVNQRIYVTNFGSNTVSVIDTKTNTLVDNPIKVGINPKSIAYDPVNQKMYVTNFGSNTVSAIDTNTNLPGPAIYVGTSPRSIAYDPVNAKMYVSLLDNDTIAAIDTKTNTLVDNPIKVGINPKSIAYDLVNQRMYVTNFGGEGMVSVIETRNNTKLGAPIKVGSMPQSIIYDPVNQRIYVTNFGSNTVSTINTNSTNQKSYLYIDSPFGLAYDPANERLFVSSRDNGQIDIIDTKTNSVMAEPIYVGGDPQGLAYDPFNQRLYVSDDNSSSVLSVQMISLNTPLVSSVDGFGYNVTNGTATLSDTISFSFNETVSSTHEISGYECSLDGSRFSSCVSPQSYSGLDRGGDHTFKVRTLDKYGKVGQLPTSFVWHINNLSPQTSERWNLICESRDGLDGRSIERFGQHKGIPNPIEISDEQMVLEKQLSQCSKFDSHPPVTISHYAEKRNDDGSFTMGIKQDLEKKFPHNSSQYSDSGINLDNRNIPIALPY
jgi:YVTN family beta-propeller protein